MRVIYVDDEQCALDNFEYEVRNMEGISSYQLFIDVESAMKYVSNNQVDVAFLDMEIAGTMGTTLAEKLKKISPEIVIVYITAYSQYTYEAYKTGGRAYLLKPYSGEELLEIVDFLNRIFQMDENQVEKKEELIQGDLGTHKIFFKTFGSFDLFIDGHPVIFKNAKSKELLALLLDKRGGVLNNMEIFSYLWPESSYTKSTSTYVRKTLQALQGVLEENHCDHLVSFHRNSVYFNHSLFYKDYFDCDYYSVFIGQPTYMNEYTGYYMSQYSWAEESIFALDNKIRSIKNQDS